MAEKNETPANILNIQPERSSTVTPDQIVDMIVNTKIELYNAYIDINRRAAKGEFIRSVDFFKAEEKYQNRISEISDILDQSDYKQVMDKVRERLSKWQEEHKLYHKEALDTEQINKIFSRDYIIPGLGKKTDINPDTKTQEELFNQLLGKNEGLAFAGVKDNSAEIALVAKNMKLFHDKGVGVVYVVGNPADIEILNRFSKDDLKKMMANISSIMEKTPSASEEYSDYKKTMNIANLALSAKENNVSLEAISSILSYNDVRQLQSQQHAIARNNFVLTEEIQNAQLVRGISNKQDHHNKYIVIGDIKNFISTLDKANGNVDEALGIAVITLRTINDQQPAIERGKSPNGADFYLSTNACRPDTKGLALAGDYDDMSKAILKNIDRMPNEEDAKAAKHYASLLDKKATNLRSDYARSLEVCDVPTQEASAPPATPTQMLVAANTPGMKK